MTDEPISAALFVDFDNVFGSLHRLNPAAADVFATKPEEWLRYFEEGRHDPAGRPRRILLRRCYLNPAGSLPFKGNGVRFERFRSAFADAAFSVADCPSLTKSGKSSADAVMIMDIMDALRHETRFAEFIIMSGDSDFAPVLVRLRTHDRRTTVVAQFDIVKAYRAAADRVVPHDRFVAQAIALPQPPPPPPPVIVEPPPDPLHEIIVQAVRDLLVIHNGQAELARLGQDIRNRIPLPEGRTWPKFRAFLTKRADPRIQMRNKGDSIFVFDPEHVRVEEPPAPLPEEPPLPEDPEPTLRKDILRTARAILREAGRDIHLPQMTKALRDRIPALREGEWPGGVGLRVLLEEHGAPSIGLKRVGAHNTLYVCDALPDDDALLTAVTAAVRDRVLTHGPVSIVDMPEAVYLSFPHFEEMAADRPWFGRGSARALLDDLASRDADLTVSGSPPRMRSIAAEETLRQDMFDAVHEVLAENGGQTPLTGLSTRVRRRVERLNGRGLPGGETLVALLESNRDDRIRLRPGEEPDTTIVYDPTVEVVTAPASAS
jgi:hypothetical protein